MVLWGEFATPYSFLQSAQFRLCCIFRCSDSAFAKFLCGLSLDVRSLGSRTRTELSAQTWSLHHPPLPTQVKHGDLSTIQTSGNVFYEDGGRVLLTGAMDHDGDGENDPEMKCHNPIDCSQKCLYLERTSRHGAGAPPACGLCDQYCSSNVVSTIMDLKDALWEDVFTVLHLIGTCFGNLGLTGCMCQVCAPPCRTARWQWPTPPPHPARSSQ